MTSPLESFVLELSRLVGRCVFHLRTLKQTPLIIILSLLGFLGFVTIWRGFTAGSVTATLGEVKTYSVVFDAGSTGTRVHVFHFDCSTDKHPYASSPSHFSEEACRLVPLSENRFSFFHSIEGGLSSHKDRPENARFDLLSLIDSISLVIPGRASIFAFLGATAGLRLLPESAQKAILSEVGSVVDKKFPGSEVKVIDGNDEARYQWRTVSFLTGNPRAVVVDLGGGSVQLAFRSPRGPRNDNEAAYMQVIGENAGFLQDKKYLFLHSWLGFGLRAGRMKILEAKETSACVHSPVDYTYSEKTISVKPSPGDCHMEIYEAMKVGKGCPDNITPCAFDGGWRGPPISEKDEIYLFSYIFDLSKRLGLIADQAHIARFPLNDLKKAALNVCSTPVRDDPYFCLDATFISVLISDGLGFGGDRFVNVAKKLEYQGSPLEASWPLGAALIHQEL